jgi:hypothetical protein
VQSHGARLGRVEQWAAVELLSAIEIDGRRIPLGNQMSGGSILMAPLANGLPRMSVDAHGAQTILKDLPDGRYRGYLCIDMSLTPIAQAPPALNPRQRAARGAPPLDWSTAARDHVSGKDGKALVIAHLRLPFAFELVPDDQQIITPVNDESLRQAVTNSLKVDELTTSSRMITLRVSFAQPPPTDLAFSVIARTASEEVRLGMVALRRGESRTAPFRLLGVLPPYRSYEKPRGRIDTIDIILTPDGDAALHWPGVKTFWNHEIVMKDVEVDDLVHHTAAEVAERKKRLNRRPVSAGTPLRLSTTVPARPPPAPAPRR